MADQLKPFEFKPGQSGNPSGRPKIAEEEKLARENFRLALANLGTKTRKELQDIINDPNSPAAYVLQASALSHFLKKGNPGLLGEMNNRILGKQADIQIEQNTIIDPDTKARMLKMVLQSNLLRDPEIRQQMIDQTAALSKDVPND